MFNNGSYVLWSNHELFILYGWNHVYIATDLFFGAILLFAGFNAGKFGLDRWVIPFIRKMTTKDNRVLSEKLKY